MPLEAVGNRTQGRVIQTGGGNREEQGDGGGHSLEESAPGSRTSGRLNERVGNSRRCGILPRWGALGLFAPNRDILEPKQSLHDFSLQSAPSVLDFSALEAPAGSMTEAPRVADGRK